MTGPDGRPLIRYGRPVYRVLRPGWQQVLTDLGTGAARAVLAEDLDRVARDPRDIEDLIDAVAACGGHARSLSGSLTLTEGGSSDQLAMARVMVTMAAKSSADTARRVAARAERLAGQSYQGGRRPFGYRPDPDAPVGAKTLIIVEAEAGVIRQAAADILDRGISLKAIARDLREAGVPTVTGAPWTASTLRDVLSKPAVAGIAVHTATVKGADRRARKVTTEHPGAWPAILPRDQWERLRDLFDGRKTGTSPEPRWLLSGYATCGPCGAVVKCTGSASRRAYTCTAHGHVRRAAAAVDGRVSALVVARLSQARRDAVLLNRRPGRASTRARCAPRRSGWAPRRRAGRAVRRRRDHRNPAHRRHEGHPRPPRQDRRAARRQRRPGPAGRVPRAARRRGLGLAVPAPQARRGQALMIVTILPARRKGNVFDPDSVRIAPLA